MSAGPSFEYFNPTKILCGGNALVHLPYELSQIGVDLPFVMFDGGTASAARKKLTGAFQGSGMTLALFEDVATTPDEKMLKDTADLFRQNSCNGIIALGDDSVVNAARWLALSLADDGLDPARFAGRNVLQTPLTPFVQVPCGLYCRNGALPVVQTDQWQSVSPFLLPDLVVLDTRFFTPTDLFQSLSCALLTLSICVESFADKRGNPITESLAVSTVASVMQYFTGLFKQENGRHEECFLAHAQMTAGIIMAQSDPMILPMLAEELAQTCDGDTGLICGILLPYFADILAHKHAETVAELLLACNATERFAIAAETLKASCAVNTLHDLMQRLGAMTNGRIATTLEAVGVPWKHLDRIAQSNDRAEAFDGEWKGETVLELLTHAWRGIPLAMKRQGGGDANKK